MTPDANGLQAAGHGMAAPRGQDPLAGTGGGRFGRMFAPGPDLEADTIDDLVRWMGVLSGMDHSDNTRIPAGYTYLGQFIDHDITFDPLSKLDRDNDPHALVNFRTPRYDLDSVYGSGPADQPFLYKWTDRDDRGVKLLVGLSAGGDDLPRNAEDIATIGDARNDENLIVSQLHLLFIQFHNRVVDHLRRPDLKGSELFDAARTVVRWHYQWIVVHDFLPLIVGEDVLRSVLRPGAAPDDPATIERLFYQWDDRPFIPVEFSAAAYRFGHSMVRNSYIVRKGSTPNIFPDAGTDAGDGDLTGFRALPSALRIDWDRFFFKPPVSNAGSQGRNNSMRINNRINPRLFAVPHRGVLPSLNLHRGRRLGLASGQQVAHAMQDRLLPSEPLPLTEFDLQLDPAGMSAMLSEATPLWYYLLAEANARNDSGKHLGPIGGRIVSEVLLGLLEGDPQSYLSQRPAWKPTLRAHTPGLFTMLDLVNFALDRAATPDLPQG